MSFLDTSDNFPGHFDVIFGRSFRSFKKIKNKNSKIEIFITIIFFLIFFRGVSQLPTPRQLAIARGEQRDRNLIRDGGAHSKLTQQ